MTAAHDGQVVPATAAARRAAKSDTHWVLALLMVVVGIGAIAGVIVAATMGLTNLALAIGIVGCAFFARAWC